MGIGVGVGVGSCIISAAGVGIRDIRGLCMGAKLGICTLVNVVGVGASTVDIAGLFGVDNGGNVARLRMYAIWM